MQKARLHIAAGLFYRLSGTLVSDLSPKGPEFRRRHLPHRRLFAVQTASFGGAEHS